MKTVAIVYKGDLRTEAEHLRSGTKILTDAPVDNQGKGEAFSPTDLVATALVTCMLSIMGIKARDKGWSIEGSTGTVLKVMASNPRRISELHVELTMQHEALDDKDRSLLEKAAMTCPVFESIHPDIEVSMAFNW